MKNRILFAFIGGVIFFIWSFISWAAAPWHQNSMAHTDHQDDFLAYFAEKGLEPGMYILGMPEDRGEEGRAEFKERYEGKPYASLNYLENNTDSMGDNFVRGFLSGTIVLNLLYFVFAAQKDAKLLDRVLFVVAIGFAGMVVFPYQNHIWFPRPDMWGYLLDALVPWALVGVVAHKLA